MRNRIAILALTVACILGTPAMAQTVGAGSPVIISVDEARDIAAFNGVVLIRKIEFDDGHGKSRAATAPTGGWK